MSNQLITKAATYTTPQNMRRTQVPSAKFEPKTPEIGAPTTLCNCYVTLNSNLYQE
jgi:hypothetical protein